MKNRESFSTNFPPQKQLSVQLLVRIFLFYLLIAISITVFQMYMEISHEHQHLKKQVDTFAETFQPSLSEALWNYDTDQLNAAMKGLNQTQEISGIRIEDGSHTYQRGSYIDKEGLRRESVGIDVVLVTKEYALYDQLFEQTYSLPSPEDDKETLGYLHLYFSSVTVLERTYYTLILMVVTAMIKTFCLWGLTYLLVTYWVTRPVNRLQRDMMTLDLYGVDKPPEQNHSYQASTSNELDFLEASFHSLCCELYEKNKLLDQYTKSLESIAGKKNEALMKSQLEIQQLNHRKGEMLYALSKDLSKPLIQLTHDMNEWLEQNHVYVADQKGLSLSCQCEYMLCLIQNISDIVLVEQGRLSVQRREVNLAHIAQILEKTFHPLAMDKHLQLRIDPPPNVVFMGDEQRIKQVLFNLIDNGIKFTKKGLISLTWTQIEQNQQPHLMVVIKDTGIGIPENHFDRLFVDFHDLGDVENQAMQGIGIGLSVSKAIIEAHDGKIHVSSIVSKGSEFKIILPLNTEFSLKEVSDG